MDDKLNELGEYVVGALPGAVIDNAIRHGELIVTVKRDQIVPVLTNLRDDPALLLELLVDICGVDLPDRRRSGSTSSTIFSASSTTSACGSR